MAASTLHASTFGSVPSIGTVAISSTAPQTITNKARDLLGLAAQVALRVRAIDRRLWPVDEKENDAPKEEPSALPWILESAEQELRAAMESLERIGSGL